MSDSQWLNSLIWCYWDVVYRNNISLSIWIWCFWVVVFLFCISWDRSINEHKMSRNDQLRAFLGEQNKSHFDRLRLKMQKERTKMNIHDSFMNETIIKWIYLFYARLINLSYSWLHLINENIKNMTLLFLFVQHWLPSLLLMALLLALVFNWKLNVISIKVSWYY